MHISGKFVFPPKAKDESIKANIRKQIGKIIPGLSDKTVDHILRIYEAYGTAEALEEKI